MRQRLPNEGMVAMPRGSMVGQWLRRYGWIAYWLSFCGLTLVAARNPGFVSNPASVPYPWTAALFTCLALGAQTAALNATLRPLRSVRSWGRVVSASGLALVFAALTLVTTATDMPGYTYAPGLFALANVVVVPLVGAGLTLSAPRQRKQVGVPLSP